VGSTSATKLATVDEKVLVITLDPSVIDSMMRHNPVLQAVVELMPVIEWDRDKNVQFYPTEEADLAQLINGMGRLESDETAILATAQEVRWPTLEKRLAIVDNEMMAKEGGEIDYDDGDQVHFEGYAKEFHVRSSRTFVHEYLDERTRWICSLQALAILSRRLMYTPCNHHWASASPCVCVCVKFSIEGVMSIRRDSTFSLQPLISPDNAHMVFVKSIYAA
jgi:hypothetical protein